MWDQTTSPSGPPQAASGGTAPLPSRSEVAQKGPGLFLPDLGHHLTSQSFTLFICQVGLLIPAQVMAMIIMGWSITPEYCPSSAYP